MRMTGEQQVDLTSSHYDAAIFDLDGVITQTARVHARAWKEMFDQFLSRMDSEFKPLDIESDYRKYIDGKPRYDGVRDFLESRGISLPEGEPQDPPDRRTVCGLGNRKNQLFREIVKRDGVDIYEDTIEWLSSWKQHGLRTGVISSSNNCKFILEVTELLYLFDVRVDGLVAQELDLPGKPAPDVFLHAVAHLDIEPERAIVFEDAIAGVEAGKAGGFGLVIGVARTDQTEELLNHGADAVISSFKQLNTEYGGK